MILSFRSHAAVTLAICDSNVYREYQDSKVVRTIYKYPCSELFDAIVDNNLTKTQAMFKADNLHTDMSSQINATMCGTGFVWSPLMWAAAAGHPQMVDYFIKRGANVNWLSRDGQECGQPLHVLLEYTNETSFKDRYRSAELLVRAGANVNKKISYRWNRTPLHYAVRSYPEKIEIFKLLIENGGDPNITDDLGAPPLMYLYNFSEPCDPKINPDEATKLSLITYLFSKGANLDISFPDGKDRVRLIDVARSCGHQRVVSFLEQNGIH